MFRMSYQAGIRIPELRVTGIVGAVGQMTWNEKLFIERTKHLHTDKNCSFLIFDQSQKRYFHKNFTIEFIFKHKF